MRVLPFDALTPVPWANGGGLTREVAAERDADGILWRVSLAEVEAEGPFSAFPGIHRILTVVRGRGMELETPDGVLRAQPMQPVRFSGALPVIGRLPGGPIRDLNVMLREGRYRGQVARLGTLPQGEGLRMLHVVAGQARIGGTPVPEGATIIDPSRPIEVEAGAGILDIRILPEG